MSVHKPSKRCWDFSLDQSGGLTDRRLSHCAGGMAMSTTFGSKCCALFYSSKRGGLHLRLASCRPALSTTHIKIQIDQLYPVIHFCSGGSIVTKHKWPSSCLKSMIIISAICQGFPKHLFWTQHQAEMDSSRRHCLPLTNHLYWHSLYSLFAPLPLAVCLFLIILILAIPPIPPPLPVPLSRPQPPPLSRSLDYVEPESGKVSLWKQGQRKWRALSGREGKRDGDRKREKDWEQASAEESTSGHLTQVCLKKGR